MLATYGSLLVILAVSCLVGQALFALCGRREWSWLAPAVGLGVSRAVAWGTVRLPGEGVASLVAIAALAGASLGILPGRVAGLRQAAAIGIPVALAATVAASAPFLVEGRFGILGTGLNPDMSQHLFAADRLAQGAGGRLLDQGYPLGPHALVVAVSEATGASLVHAFGGLTVAIGVIAALTPLALLERLAAWRRVCGALLVALPYLAASYLIQGAFKETMEALFVLAFAIGLHELARGALGRRGGASRRSGGDPARRPGGRGRLLLQLRGALVAGGRRRPVGALGAGARGTARLPGGARGARPAGRPRDRRGARRPGGRRRAGGRANDRLRELRDLRPGRAPGSATSSTPSRRSRRSASGRRATFVSTRGTAPCRRPASTSARRSALAALAYGLAWWLRRGERAVPAALAAAAILFAYAHFAGTPYQAAKAIVIASPLAMLIAARALLSPEPLVELGGLRGAIARRRAGFTGILARRQRPLRLGLAVAFLGAAAASSVLALVNGPVGPATYSPALTELRPALGRDSTLVLAPQHMLSAEHGRDYLVWELRGGRVCVEAAGTRALVRRAARRTRR